VIAKRRSLHFTTLYTTCESGASAGERLAVAIAPHNRAGVDAATRTFLFRA
jgi:hypothetical protein